MADEAIYQRIVEILDNSQYIAALQKAEQEEKVLAGLRDLGGKAAVQAHGAAEKAAKTAAAAHEKALKDEGAALAKVMQAQDTFVAALLRQKETAAGLSSEQKALNDFIRKTEAAFKSGSITASQYSDALSTIKVRQQQLATTAQPVTGALTAVTAGSKSTAAGMQQLSFQLNDVITQISSGTPPMQVLAQQGGQIFQAFQGTPGLMKSVAGGIGQVAGVGAQLLLPFLSVAIPLWYDYRSAAEAAAAGQEAINTAMEEADPLYSRALSDLKKVSELRKGSMTVDERKAEVEKQYRDDLEASNATLQESIQANEEWLAQNSANKAGWQERQDAIKSATAEMEYNTQAAEAGVEAAKLLIDFQDEEDRSSRALADAKEREAKARKKAAEAAAEERARIDELIRISKMDEERRSKLEEQIATLDKLAATAEKAAASEEERVNLAAQAATAAAQAAADEAERYATTALEKQRIEEALTEALVQITLERLTKLKELEDKAAEERRKEAEDQRKRDEAMLGNVAALAGASSDIMGAYYDSLTADAESMSAEQKKAAEKVWRAQKALAISEIGINAIKGVSAALASAPPPVNLIPAGVAIAQGAAQVAAIAASPAPTFDDTPGPVYAATGQSAMDRAPVSLHRDDILIAGKTPESVVSQAAAMGSGRSRPRLGPQLARVPVGTLLTRDVERATRGRLPR